MQLLVVKRVEFHSYFVAPCCIETLEIAHGNRVRGLAKKHSEDLSG